MDLYKEIFKRDTYSNYNKLLSLPDYKEIFPPMPTKRRGTTAVISKEHIIVAGGAIGVITGESIVKVMDTITL